MVRAILKLWTPMVLVMILFGCVATSYAQPPESRDKKQRVRTVTIPISIFTKAELKKGRTDEIIDAATLLVKEDKEDQEVLSVRSVGDGPLSIAIIVQEELDSDINVQLKSIAAFIRELPSDSKVMVAYLRGPTLLVRQKFTSDLDKASQALRIVGGGGANTPYSGLGDVMKRFEALPGGRRAVLFISDGFDASQGTSPIDVTHSIELDRAISRAQRYGVAIYSVFSPTTTTDGNNRSFALAGQAGLQRLSDETGGRAYFQGTLAPITLEPIFKDINMALGRQFALTYLSTHMKKGLHRVLVTSTNPEIKIEHPKSYTYR